MLRISFFIILMIKLTALPALVRGVNAVNEGV